MLEPARHIPLRDMAWDVREATDAIAEIVADALTHLDAERFWPAHPLDDKVEDGHTGFYVGATGMLWGLDYLARSGATHERLEPGPLVARLIAANRAEFTPETFGGYAAHGSFLFGDLGTALAAMRLAPQPAFADTVYARAEANDALPIRELMWGTPGSMLACVHMAQMTDEPRWRALFVAQATRLLGELEETTEGPLWTQDLYGSHLQYLGPVHGYAGNMIPLLLGWDWLTNEQRTRIAEAVPRTLALTAWQSEAGVNWRAVALRDTPPNLCQHCHGAPGMVTTFAVVPFDSSELDELMLRAGELAWAAGPLAKGPGLCHGTAGNGYAFLKLYRKTQDARWLDRARAFAMTAIAQCRETRTELGRGRFTLWTGDIGLAVYLRDCLMEDARFPTIDVF